jgi:hypothetical protein
MIRQISFCREGIGRLMNFKGCGFFILFFMIKNHLVYYEGANRRWIITDNV